MLAVDTNVLVRLLVGDDRRQEELAGNLIRRQPVWVAKTVLLETYWVLGSLYRFSPQASTEALRNLASLQNVCFEDETAVLRALGWTENGMDFADALHLASTGSATKFATFDRKLARQSKKLRAVEVIALS